MKIGDYGEYIICNVNYNNDWHNILSNNIGTPIVVRYDDWSWVWYGTPSAYPGRSKSHWDKRENGWSRVDDKFKLKYDDFLIEIRKHYPQHLQMFLFNLDESMR